MSLIATKNIKREGREIINYIVYLILIFVGFISSKLSIRGRNKLGGIIGDALRILSKKRERITYDNIRNAFPDYSDKKCSTILVNSYRNLGITLAELTAFYSMNEEDFKKYVKFENLELIEELKKEGRGIIFLSAHFGNWELLAYVTGLITDIPVTVIVKHQKNKFADKVLNKYRTRGGNKIVSMKNAARTIIKSIRNNEAIALLADQSATKDKDVFVDFFGKPAATYEAPAALALKFNVPVIMGFAVRQDDCTYKTNIFQLNTAGIPNTKEGIKELTQMHVKELEKVIREYPDLWSWQHKRWKHSELASN